MKCGCRSIWDIAPGCRSTEHEDDGQKALRWARTMPPSAAELIRALVEIIEQAFDGAGNAFSDPRWAEVKAVREARLWLAVHEAEEAGQKLAEELNLDPERLIKWISSPRLPAPGYAHTAKGRKFFRPRRHDK